MRRLVCACSARFGALAPSLAGAVRARAFHAPEVLHPTRTRRALRPRAHPDPCQVHADALRAALLECAGYEPRVFEFISPEHTSKNLMIVGIKRSATVDPKARTRVQELARFYGIREQRLAKRLGISLI